MHLYMFYCKNKICIFYIMSNFIVHTTHPIQPRGQTFTLDRKILTVHSYDRDIKKWPHSNEFEIDLPEDVTNIQSIRLVQISFPSNQYVFSNEYQNTKMTYTDEINNAGVSTPGTQHQHHIEISEGAYTPQELATEIENRMNVESYPITFPPSGAPTGAKPRYVCKYNDITNTFWFGNTGEPAGNSHLIWHLDFDVQEIYNTKCHQPIVWNHYTKWGLPAYLGYNKQRYDAVLTSNNGSGFTLEQILVVPTSLSAIPGKPYGFSYELTNTAPFSVWLDGAAADTPPNTLVDASGNCQLDIFGEQAIYMELDRFNSIDEIEPYSENTMGMFNNDLNGKVKAAFAKIPIPQAQFTHQQDSANNNLMNISHYNPVIERINRLKFKFRYHDGRLVDFRCVPFNFSIEFNSLRDRQPKKIDIIVPPGYYF